MKKFFLILGITVLVVIVAGVLYIGLNKDKIIASTLAPIQSAIIQQLPASVPADSVQTLFDNAIMKVKDGQADQQAIQDFMLTFKSSMDDQQLDSLETKTLLDKLQAF